MASDKRLLKKETLATACVIVAIVFVLLGLTSPPDGRIRDAANRIRSANNLREIGLALQRYHDQHGRLPPAIVRDKSGKALYSWRVVLLPYLDEEPIYRSFRLDEAWDSPHNSALLQHMPKRYGPPNIDGLQVEPGTTFYQVFVGKGAAFEGDTGLRIPDDFPDGPSNTFLLAEAGEAVPWTKPVDLEFDPDKPTPRLGGLFSLALPDHALGFNALNADGSVHFITASTSDEVIRAMITRNGKEPLRAPE
jgi:hypothetical protein